MVAEPKVRLLVGCASYDGWYEVDIDSDLFAPVDAWSVKARSPGPELLGIFREGQNIDIYVGDDRQLAGVVDEARLTVSRGEETLALSGRDKGAWLIDSDAPTVRGTNLTLQNLVEKLLKPQFGIRRVLVSNDSNRKARLGRGSRSSSAGQPRKSASIFDDTPRATTKVDPGAKIAQILDQHCRRRGIAWWLTAQGDLVLGRPTYDQDPAYQFLAFASNDRRAAHNNIEQLEVVRSISERYSKITVVAQTRPAKGKLFGPTVASKGGSIRASAVDPDLVARGIQRELVIADSDAANRQQAQGRADTEMGQRRLHGLTIRLTVPGWAQQGRLYTVDTIATVRAPAAGIEGLFYVTQRRFTETRARRRTQLTLHERRVWLP